MTMTEMMTAYKMLSAAHLYALGFVYNGLLYAVKLTFDELAQYFKLDRASSKRGGFAKIRIKLTAADRAKLSTTAELIGPEMLLGMDPKHNRGENFERELTERWTGNAWEKDSIPFWVQGDIRVNGVEIQVKFDGAELTNEKMLKKIGA